ncbi:MAG: chromate resistance protein ChrB domain-containing protein, partial [Sulfuricurvum sp.]
FVDRMASAWLIRTFIDPKAQFIFDSTIDETQENIITYDMDCATFTHVGDLCTFEVLLYSFSINDDGVRHIAKIIHNLDLNDEKYSTPEAAGIKLILSSIRNSGCNDLDILNKSNEIFDYLYQTLKS